MKKRVIAVGFFDGVHKGHKVLMDKVLEISQQKQCSSAVFTFKKHPDEIISGVNVPLLCSIDNRKEQILKLSGVDEVFLWDFTRENSQIEWDDFARNLIEKYNACHIVTGEDFQFGRKGLGNSQKLESLCRELNIGYDAIKPVRIDDIRVSSTNIREIIAKGDIKKANFLLGHEYSISAVVEHGRKIGRTIGIRTINLTMPRDMQKPANGVYVSRVTIDNKNYSAVTNVGTVPTFLNEKNIIVESHILDFTKDVYGKIAKVDFYDFLRFEQKFENIDQLKEKIHQNILQTREYFEKNT